MASFAVTGPDGKRYKVKVPEGAGQQEAIEYVKNTYYSKQPEAKAEESQTATAEPKPAVTDLRQVSRLAGIVPQPAEDLKPEPKKTLGQLALEPITSYPEVYKKKVAENVALAKEGAAQTVEDPTVLGKALGVGKTVLGGVVSVLSPVEAAIETLVAEPVEKASMGTIPKELTQTATEIALPFAPKSQLVKAGARTIEDMTKIDPAYASAVKQTERAAEAQTRASVMGPRPTPEQLKGGIAAKPIELYQEYVGRPALEFAKANPLSLATGVASSSYGLETLDEDASVADQMMAAALYGLAGFGGAKGTKTLAKNIPLGDNNVADWFSRGVIDNYGLPQDYLDVKAGAKMFKNQMSEDFMDLVKDVRKLPDNERKVLYYIMQGEEVPVESLANLSDEARSTITRYGQKMVDVGLLSPETFNKNAATYLHREYTTKLKPQSLIERATQSLRLIGSELKPRGVVVDVTEDELPKFLEQGWERFGDSKTGKVRVRRQLTKEERQAKGEIDDAAFAIARTGQLMSNDIATYKLFDDISKMDQYVSDAPREGWEQVTTDKLKGTNVAKFGNLAGKYVDPTVLNDLKAIDFSRNLSRNPAFKTYQQLLRAWKTGKTALNPTVHVNNIMSNFMLYDLSGSDWSSLARAANEIRKGSNSELYEQARKLGVFDAGFASQELGKEGRKVLDELETINPATDNVDKMFRVANAGWKQTGGRVIDAYQQEDSIFRFGIYLDRVKAGMSPEDAAAEAKKWLIDYEINAPIIQTMRNTTHPFIAYSYRAIPLLAESAAMRPWKYAKWAAMGHAVNEYGEAEGTGDTELERKMLPESQKGNWFGVPVMPPNMIKLPTEDRSEYIDVKRFIPGGDVFATTEATGRRVEFLPQALQPGGPMFDAFTILQEGRDPFTGQDLPGLNIGATEAEMRSNNAAIKASKFMTSLLPNLPGIPGTAATEKFKRAGVEAESITRPPITMTDAVLQTFGIKITPVDVEKLTVQQQFAMQRERDAVANVYKKKASQFEQGLISEEEFTKASEEFNQRLEQISEKYAKRMEPTEKNVKKESPQIEPIQKENTPLVTAEPYSYESLTNAQKENLKNYFSSMGLNKDFLMNASTFNSTPLDKRKKLFEAIEKKAKGGAVYSDAEKSLLQRYDNGGMADSEDQAVIDEIRKLPWFNRYVKKFGEEPDLSPSADYDYITAYKSGARPDETDHWPSYTGSGIRLKKANHPTLWKTLFMDKTGIDPDSIGIKNEQEGQAFMQRQKLLQKYYLQAKAQGGSVYTPAEKDLLRRYSSR